MLRPLAPDQVTLLPGIFKQRHELNRKYLLELQADNLLQNHYFEAGIWGPPAKPDDTIHWGWEAPNSLVRGHFLGHWMAAAARVTAATGDPQLDGRLKHVVSELARCQEENGGEWVSSIPEKYLHRIAQGRGAWAPQYVAGKTLMGLWETYALTGNEQALEVLDNASRWFHRWTAPFDREQMDDILDYETCGLLEIFAELYGTTGRQDHLDLVERYDRPRLFDRLVAGDDLLTNFHANTTIPEALGAARAYEVTGDKRWREVVDAYWRLAVTERDAWCTGGQTAGEVWTPPGQLSARMGINTQEHCTVYNMMRLAEYLLRWTGDATYADYRDRNLWNGILAQQHPHTGVVSYFLPMRAGATKKWGTKTADFWCCYGTLVEAHSRHGTGTYYQHEDGGLVVTGYVPASVRFTHDGADLTVTLATRDPKAPVPAPGQVDLSRDEGTSRPTTSEFSVRVASASGEPVEMDLTLPIPWWVAGPARITVDGQPVEVSGPDGFRTITRAWTDNVVKVELPRALTTAPLPDRPDTVAFLDGPVVLAGLCDEERALVGDAADPATMLTADNEREWDYWNGSYRTVGQDRGIRFLPLHEVVDEPFTLYFPVRKPERSAIPDPRRG
ncbi:MAG TPA: beta-L-arabinofuranosidase domain-containing protein [Acidimicrobiales bacterium]|nr:beta-L-arabinofuranosidase domain-containing protein [Acidimicrobiales bacterium]